jgi:hypothetical protein
MSHRADRERAAGSANIAEAVMVEAVPESIPTNLRDAFHFAVLCTPRHWSGEDPDPEIISLDLKPFTPSAICGLVTKFADPMPQYIYDVLRELGLRGSGPFVCGRRSIRHQPDRESQGAVSVGASTVGWVGGRSPQVPDAGHRDARGIPPTMRDSGEPLDADRPANAQKTDAYGQKYEAGGRNLKFCAPDFCSTVIWFTRATV